MHLQLSLPTHQLPIRFCICFTLHFFLNSDGGYIYGLCHKVHSLSISGGNLSFWGLVHFVSFHLQLSLYSLSLMCRVLETVSSTIFMTSRNTNVICVQDTNMPFFKSGHVKIIFLISIVFCETFAVCNLPRNIFFRFFGVLVD